MKLKIVFKFDLVFGFRFQPTFISDKEYESNVSLSYEYLEKSVKEVQDIINNANTQLGVLVGFNFTFVRFFISEIPGDVTNHDSLPCNSCL